MSEWPLRLMSFAGLLVMLAVAFALSENRRRISRRVVLTGLGLQLVLAVLVFLTGAGNALFAATDKAFAFFMAASNEGAGFLFGRLTTDYTLGAVVAFQVLPIVIFFSSLAGILYHFGVTQFVVRAMARIMQKIMNISGAESLASALFVFFGIESTTAIAHYIRRMTRSELFTLMTAFMATIAGTVMGAYVSFVVRRCAGPPADGQHDERAGGHRHRQDFGARDRATADARPRAVRPAARIGQRD